MKRKKFKRLLLAYVLFILTLLVIMLVEGSYKDLTAEDLMTGRSTITEEEQKIIPFQEALCIDFAPICEPPAPE